MCCNTDKTIEALMAAKQHGSGIKDLRQNEAFQAGIIEVADQLGLLSEYAQALKAAK